MLKNIKNIFSLIFFSAIIFSFLYYIWYSNDKWDRASKGEIQKAYVTQKLSSAKGPRGILYVYRYKGGKYEANAFFGKSDYLDVFDTIYIAVEKDNPNNSIPIFDSIKSNDF